jgi:hypothetical protein
MKDETKNIDRHQILAMIKKQDREEQGEEGCTIAIWVDLKTTTAIPQTTHTTISREPPRVRRTSNREGQIQRNMAARATRIEQHTKQILITAERRTIHTGETGYRRRGEGHRVTILLRLTSRHTTETREQARRDDEASDLLRERRINWEQDQERDITYQTEEEGRTKHITGRSSDTRRQLKRRIARIIGERTSRITITRHDGAALDDFRTIGNSDEHPRDKRPLRVRTKKREERGGNRKEGNRQELDQGEP